MAALFRNDNQENGETEADTLYKMWEKGAVYRCRA
jgi:hypothetical protein